MSFTCLLARHQKFKITLVVWKTKSEQLFETEKEPVATIGIKNLIGMVLQAAHLAADSLGVQGQRLMKQIVPG